MLVVAESINENLRYTLSPRRQEAVHDKLEEILPNELASIFLFPREKGKKTQWGLLDEYAQIEKILRYSQLGENEKSLVGDKLQELYEFLNHKENSIPEIKGLSRKICSIPSIDSAMLLVIDGIQRVALADWAHLPMDPSKGLMSFEKIVGKPRPKFPTKLQFLYSDGSCLINENIKIRYRGYLKEHETDKTGIVDQGHLPIGAQLEVYRDSGGKITSVGEVTTKSGQELYTVTLDYLTDLLITVKDDKGHLLDDFTLRIENQGVLHDQKSSKGRIEIGGLLAGTHVRISDKEGLGEVIDYRLQKTDNHAEYIVNTRIILPPPDPKSTKFYLYDFDGSSLSNATLKIKQSSDLETTYHDGGYYTIPSNKLQQNKKAKALIEVNRDEKIIKQYVSRLRIEPNKSEYHIKLKRNYWWLLLLLIPLLLLLLLTLNKSFVVQVHDFTGKPVSEAHVSFDYSYENLFDFEASTFFSNASVSRVGNTSLKGNAAFDTLAYTLYDRLFYNSRKARIRITTFDNCLMDTTVYIKFYKWNDTIKVKVKPTTQDLDFIVRSVTNLEPVENANVNYTLSFRDIVVQRGQMKSDKNGSISLKAVPICGVLNQISADKSGYFPDTIINKSITFLSEDILNRTLYLNKPQPCDTRLSGGIEGLTKIYKIDYKDKEYILSWDFLVQKDRLILREGPYKSGRILFDTWWKSGTGDFDFIPDQVCGGCDFINIEIKGSVETTEWHLNLNCPNN